MSKKNFIMGLSFLMTILIHSSIYSQTVTIGNQVWMTKNLDLDKFRNGDPIPEAKTNEEWKKAGENKQPAWCYYNNEPANGTKYGKLYNWYAVTDPRGLAPKGWHIPTDMEWTILIDYLGGPDVAGGKMKSTGSEYWKSPNREASNESGFSGLPGGYRGFNGYFFFHLIGENGYWWSSTENYANSAWYRYLVYYYGKAYRDYFGNSKNRGLSVRCIKD